MEMVSAVKMRKSQVTALSARPFAYHIITLLERLAQLHETGGGSAKRAMENNLFFRNRRKGITILVLIAPDKGLVGGLNTALFSHTQQEIQNLKKRNREIQAIAIGNKAAQFLENADIPILAFFTHNARYDDVSQIQPVVDSIIEHYRDIAFREVAVLYTEFFSTLRQKPSTRYILPITIEQIEKTVESVRPQEGRFSGELTEPIKDKPPEYIFEPSPHSLLTEIAPFLVLILMYHITLDANASEHSARMLAMRNASTNAEQILEDLTRSYNKVRQSSITQEIAEISAATIK